MWHLQLHSDQYYKHSAGAEQSRTGTPGTVKVNVSFYWCQPSDGEALILSTKQTGFQLITINKWAHQTDAALSRLLLYRRSKNGWNDGDPVHPGCLMGAVLTIGRCLVWFESVEMPFVSKLTLPNAHTQLKKQKLMSDQSRFTEKCYRQTADWVMT